MALLVLKFGGTSVGDTTRIKNVANIVKKELDAGHQVAVVVSAMSGTTNQLVKWTQEISVLPDAREYDAVVAAGEQITAGLTAVALQAIGIPSRSWLGWQVPIRTDGMHGRARIQEIDTDVLKKNMLDGQVPVVAGFQGISPEGRITTVGRGGSDTAAVALAAALKADRCDIYTDVDGVYTCDPRIVTKARKLNKISFEEMLEMASLGAKVLQTRSVELAMKERVRLQVKSTFAEDVAGTFVVTEEEMSEADMLEQQVISGITYSRDEAKITLKAVEDKPGVSAKIFGPLAEQGINVDMIVQNISEEKNARTDMTFTVTRGDVERAVKTLEDNRAAIGFAAVHVDKDVAKVSVVGLGMRSHVGVAQTMFRTLAEKNINIRVIATSEIKISVLIEEAYTELALRALHTAYGLDAA
jgi:aspartate kinase